MSNSNMAMGAINEATALLGEGGEQHGHGNNQWGRPRVPVWTTFSNRTGWSSSQMAMVRLRTPTVAVLMLPTLTAEPPSPACLLPQWSCSEINCNLEEY